MCEGSVFTAKYARKVQPWNYEYIMIGHEEQFPQSTSREEAHRIVRECVEAEIDRRLQELYAREKGKR